MEKMMNTWTTKLLKLLKISRNDGGQALVETALTMPFLLALLLGAFEFGRAAYAATEVTSAARAAAQYGAMNGGGFLDSSGMLWAANQDAANLNNNIQWSTGYPSVSCSCSGSGTAYCSSGTDPYGCSTSQLMVTVNVKLQYSVKPLVNLPGLPSSYTVYGRASQGLLQ